MAELATASVRIRPTFANFRAETEAGITGAVSSAARKATAILGVAFGAKAAFNLGKNIIGDAAAVQKSTEVIRAQFGRAGQSIVDFADKGGLALGVASHETEAVAARFGILFHNLGIGQAQAAGMTVNLEKLADSIAAIRGVDPATILERLPTALSGNIRSLRQLGLSIDQSQIKLAAFKLGLTTSINQALTPAAKAQAIYALATANLGTYQAQAAAHAGDLYNVQRRLSAEWDHAKEALGTRLLPEFTKAATTLSDFIDRQVRSGAAQRELNTIVSIAGSVLHTFGQAAKVTFAVFQGVSGVLGGTKRAVEDLLTVLAVAKIARIGNALQVSLIRQGILPIGAASRTAAATFSGSSAEMAGSISGLTTAVKALTDEIRLLLDPAITTIGTTAVRSSALARGALAGIGSGAVAGAAVTAGALGGVRGSLASVRAGALLVPPAFLTIGGAAGKAAAETDAAMASIKASLSSVSATALKTDAYLAGVGASAARGATVAAGPLARLRGSLVGLTSKLWTVAIALSIIPPNKQGQDALNKYFGGHAGFLGKLPLIGPFEQQAANLGVKAGNAFDKAVAGIFPKRKPPATGAGTTSPFHAALTQTFAQARLLDPKLTRAQYELGRKIAEQQQKAVSGGFLSLGPTLKNLGRGFPALATKTARDQHTAVRKAYLAAVAANPDIVVPYKVRLELATAKTNAEQVKALRDKLAVLNRALTSGVTGEALIALQQDKTQVVQQLQSLGQAAASTTRNVTSNVATVAQTAHERIASSVLAAKKNLDAIGQKLADQIAQIQAKLGGTATSLATSPQAVAFKKLRDLIAGGGGTVEVQRAAQQLSTQLQARASAAAGTTGTGTSASTLKAKAGRQVADLTDELNKGQITLKTFNRKVAALLTADNASFKTAGKTNGRAFADAFRAELRGIHTQAGVIAALPPSLRHTGGGGGDATVKIIRPLDQIKAQDARIAVAQHRVQERTAKAAERTARAAEKNATETAKTNATLKQLSGVKVAPLPGHAAKNAKKGAKAGIRP